MPELPTGTVTFLFTDLEGSTRLWEEHPDAMRAALARHDEILREAVEKHEGHVVKTTGDGLHAAFAVATDAATAAVEAQRALLVEEWALPEPLRVRMGLHTGTAEIRDADYYGTAVNRAARVSAAAHGGQILMSATTSDLVRDDLPSDAMLRDLGEHRLRDLARAEHVFQLSAPGLEVEFPTLRSSDEPLGNLSPSLSSFVGRQSTVGSVATALLHDRLVTLTGVGGVGKTRLAAQVAAEVVARFRDGAWFCELAAVGTPDGLVQNVAATVGARPHPDAPLQATTVDFLRSKALLVILDNCEHLLGAAGRLAADILRACPEVRILATSREGLGVDGERIFAVGSLELPGGRDITSVAASEAAQLFAERGAAARAGFAIDETNAASIAEICTRLDGIPLALELAAARLSAMSASEIADHLDERFRLLAGGRQLAVERHQTLRSTVDWSYELLGDRERAVFDRSGVFVGSFDAAAATRVVGNDELESWDVLDALRDLVSKSMLVAEETRDGSTRYQLLETLRQYARERLDEAHATDHFRRRHAACYAEWAERAGPGLLGRDELEWRAALRVELDNLRAAVAWALDTADPADQELALRIVAALSFQATGDRASGISTWAAQALPFAEGARPALRIAVIGAAGWDSAMRLDYERARELTSTAFRLLEENPEVEWTSAAAAVGAAGVAALYTGRFEEASELAQRFVADERARSVAVAMFDAAVGTVPVMAELLGGNWPAAREHAEEAVAIARRVGNPSGIALALYVFGWALTYDDPPAALAAFDESIALVRSGASDQTFAHVLVRAGELRAAEGDAAALDDLREALVFADDVGSLVTTMSVLDYGMRILASLDHAELAAVIAGFLDSGEVISLNPVDGSEALARQRTRDRIERSLGATSFEEARRRGAPLSYRELSDLLLRELDEARRTT